MGLPVWNWPMLQFVCRDSMMWYLDPSHLNMNGWGCSCLLKVIKILCIIPGILGFILMWLLRVSLKQNTDTRLGRSVLLKLQMDARHDVWRHLQLYYKITRVLAESHSKQRPTPQVTTEKHILPWKSLERSIYFYPTVTSIRESHKTHPLHGHICARDRGISQVLFKPIVWTWFLFSWSLILTPENKLGIDLIKTHLSLQWFPFKSYIN